MLELWFDFSCPYAYLASLQAARWGAEIDWRPMLLGGVFRGIAHGPNGDGPMAALSEAKARNNVLDMHRWADVFGAPFRMPAAHPMRTVRALRVLLALPHREWPRAIAALYAAYWVRGEDIAIDTVIASALTASGIEPGDAFARADSDEIKADLRARTDEAIELGIFGAPAWVMRRADGTHALVWGQDRLAWVDEMRRGWDPDRDPPDGPRMLAVAPAHPGATLDVYFDVSSPFGYLALAQLPALAAQWGITPRLHPILLGGLFKDIGTPTAPLLSWPPAKQRYTGNELDRWSRWYGVPFTFPGKFPQRTILAQRVLILAAERGFAVQCALAIALARAMWAERRDLEELATVRDVLATSGLPVEWIERTNEPPIKAALIANTTRAREVGAFGVPTFIVDDRLVFWGQDRLELVAKAVAGWVPAYEAATP